MNLQSLSSIDLPALSRSQLSSLVRALRDGEGDTGWIDTRTTSANLIKYVEAYKTRLAEQELAAVKIEEPTAPAALETTDETVPETTDEAATTSGVDVVVVYHKKNDLFHCVDGVVSAILAKKALAAKGKKVSFLAGTYYNNPSLIERINKLSPRRVLLLDYSIPLADIKGLNTTGVTVCDHHKDACERLIHTIRAQRSLSQSSPHLVVRFNNNKSGARLTWEYFFPGTEPPALVEYVEDGDLFTFCLPHSELIYAGVHSLLSEPGMSLDEVEAMIEPAWWMSRRQFAEHFKGLGKFANVERRKRILSAASKAKVMMIHGRKAVAVKVRDIDQDIVSALGKHLYSQDFFIDNDLKFVALYHEEGDLCCVSLRSSGYNCLPVAKAYGGGGHEQACGFALAGKFADHFPDRPTAY